PDAIPIDLNPMLVEPHSFLRPNPRPWITAAAHKPNRWHVDGRAPLPTSPRASLFFCLKEKGVRHRLSYLSLRFKIGSPSCLATLKMT
ncbi:hypothetical protein, partial [Aeromonas veronii]|uniref:hypothetical protein n=1 Tax=Aeromonas veronii TaxID=654 RepID=UPI001F487420